MRLGVAHLPSDSADAFTAAARRAEALGFDVIAAPDHLGLLSPFAALVAAGAATARARLRTYVLNACFWNPALLVRDAATTQLLTGGRLELGLGAGHMRSEFDAADIEWRPAPARIEALAHLARTARRELAGVPIVIGAMSDRGLAVAAELADVIAFAGLRQIAGRAPGTFRLAGATETDALVAHVAARRDPDRPYEADALLQAVRIGGDPRAAASDWAAASGGLDVELLLDSPFALFARDIDEGATELARRRERYGFTSFTTFWSEAEALVRVREAFDGS